MHAGDNAYEKPIAGTHIQNSCCIAQYIAVGVTKVYIWGILLDLFVWVYPYVWAYPSIRAYRYMWVYPYIGVLHLYVGILVGILLFGGYTIKS